MEIRVDCPTAEDTYAVAARLAPLLRAGDVIALSGPLGCGKTLFTGGVAAALGVDGPIPSPTFVLARQYDDGFLTLVHVDVYRLGSYNEFLDLGVLDAAAEGVLVVEWGEAVESLLPEHLLVRFEVGSREERVLTFRAPPSWLSRSLEEVAG
jgi:tRNA threonylcarbamoyladenosine biosynthesis protein TsaE